MWREDDFEDKGRQIKVAPNNEAPGSINDADAGSECKAERLTEEPSS